MECSVCQSDLPAGDEVFCEKCDLYHVDRSTWNSLNELLAFLNGKKFIFHEVSIGTYGAENARLGDFKNAMLVSPDVRELNLCNFNNPEELIDVVDLVEKLPNCSNIHLTSLTINEHTAQYLSKLMAFPKLRAIKLRGVTFTFDACQVFAKTMDPSRFSMLSLEECDIANASPIINALVNTDLTTVPSFVNRLMTDEECKALSNLIKCNTRIEIVNLSNLSNTQSKKLAEVLKDAHHVKEVYFSNSDLAMASIAELLCASKSINICSITFCDMTLAQLTELCDGLKERKNTADLTLDIAEGNYEDSLEPICKLLKSDGNLPGLSIKTSSSAQEWISVCESLKKNTTLKRFSILVDLVEAAEKAIDAITDMLNVNNTLQYLFVVTQHPVDQIVKVAVSRNKLESLHIRRGILKDLDVAKLCDMLKSNWKLKEFHFRNGPPFKNTPEHVKLFQDMMEVNYSLVECNIIRNAFVYIKPYKERNQKFQEQWTETKQDILVTIHNLARNAETIRKLLPIDMWLEVFKRLRYPLMPNSGFEDVARKIFKQYKLY